MRASLKFVLGIGLCAIQMGVTASIGYAADLRVKPAVHHVRVIHRAHVRVVRDYDGTPIVLRRSHFPVGVYEADWAQRASPTRYLNGQPVRSYFVLAAGY